MRPPSFRFRCHAGLLWIRPQPQTPDCWSLGLNDEVLGSYDSPRLAASDVDVQSTGNLAIDTLPNSALPHELGDWERLV